MRQIRKFRSRLFEVTATSDGDPQYLFIRVLSRGDGRINHQYAFELRGAGVRMYAAHQLGGTEVKRLERRDRKPGLDVARRIALRLYAGKPIRGEMS